MVLLVLENFFGNYLIMQKSDLIVLWNINLNFCESALNRSELKCTFCDKGQDFAGAPSRIVFDDNLGCRAGSGLAASTDRPRGLAAPRTPPRTAMRVKPPMPPPRTQRSAID